jgi:hypothetical protein
MMPNRRASDRDSAVREQLHAVLEALHPLRPEDRVRVIATAARFYGVYVPTLREHVMMTDDGRSAREA